MKHQAQNIPKRAGLFKNLLHQGAANFSSNLASLLLMPLVIKKAGAGTYGTFVILNSLFTLVTQAFTLGAGYKCRRLLPTAVGAIARERLFSPTVSFQLVTYVAAAATLVLALPAINKIFFHGVQPPTRMVVPAVVVSIFLTYLGDDYFRYTQRVKFISIVTVFRAFGFPMLVLAFGSVLDQLSIDHLLVAQTVSSVVPSAVLWYFIFKETSVRLRFDSWSQYRADIQYGLPLVTAVLVENFLATSDRYILASRLSAAHVGSYSAASALGSLILIVPKIISAVLPASLAQAFDHGEKEKAEFILNQALQGYIVLAIPFVCGVAILAPTLLSLIANAEVAALARWVPPLVAIGSALYGYTWIIFSSLFVQMETKVWLKANIAAAITSVTLNFLLLSLSHRIEAAAVSMTISYALSAFIIERSRNRSWNIKIDYSIVVKCTLAALLMILVVWLSSNSALAQAPLFLSAIVQIGIGVLVYIVALKYLGLFAVLGWQPERFFRKNTQ